MALLSLTPAMLFADRYRVIQRLAQGGMGAVYEVVHVETNRRRALKVMLPSVLQRDDMRDRFRLEARVTASIESEFLVDVVDAGVDDATGLPFMVMELLRGEDLNQRLTRVGRFSSRDVVTYLHQASLALDKTHKAAIVHRDLKPSNLFRTERDDGTPRIKILDFGIAKLVAEITTSSDTSHTLGTPSYMAPEQFHLDRRVSPACDIYALGMLAYTLLVGTTYWHDEIGTGASVFAFAVLAMAGPTEPPAQRALRKGVKLPPEFDAWFAKVTAFTPTDRFRSATSAVHELAVALGVPLPAREREADDPSRSSVEPTPLATGGSGRRSVPDQRFNETLVGPAPPPGSPAAARASHVTLRGSAPSIPDPGAPLLASDPARPDASAPYVEVRASSTSLPDAGVTTGAGVSGEGLAKPPRATSPILVGAVVGGAGLLVAAAALLSRSPAPLDRAPVGSSEITASSVVATPARPRVEAASSTRSAPPLAPPKVTSTPPFASSPAITATAALAKPPPAAPKLRSRPAAQPKPPAAGDKVKIPSRYSPD